MFQRLLLSELPVLNTNVGNIKHGVFIYAQNAWFNWSEIGAVQFLRKFESNMSLEASPSSQQEEVLPLYEGITLADVLLVDTPAADREATAALLAADVIGVDSESKPTFRKGEVSTGPHLVQLATDSKVFLYQVERLASLDGLRAVLESPQVLKVGFGLESDIARLKSKLGIELNNVLDLAKALRPAGQRNMLGAKSGVALYFGQRLQKSKRISTSNWAQPRLNERQMLYAADDAHVALRIYRAAQGKAQD